MMRFAPLFLTAAVLTLGWIPTRSEILAALKDPGANRHDTERMERGYYEQLLDSGRRLTVVEPAPFDAGRLCDVVTDLREYVLKPNLKTTHRGASWTTNSLGMRDREYDLKKPVNTLRIALVGDSIGAGWGVDDGQAFESLIEETMNQSVATRHIEILNFSVPGHAPGQRWEQFRRVGWPMSPDVVIFEATPADPGWDERRLRGLLAREIGWDAPQYRDALEHARASRGGNMESYKATLKPHRWAILENVYRSAVAECLERNVLPVWVLIPRVGKPMPPADRTRLVELARSSGFAVVVDVSDAFEGIDPAELAISADDFHPNVRGHRILAGKIEKALVEALREGHR
jgi:lysophospholipase L1-like esterase